MIVHHIKINHDLIVMNKLSSERSFLYCFIGRNRARLVFYYLLLRLLLHIIGNQFNMPINRIECAQDGSCPYQYSCQQHYCVHQPVFPVTGYPIALYCLFPIASAICNTSGNSFGEFKVLLLMVALNYSEEHATILSYPLVLGTALYNIIRLVMQRHPYKKTSLVDYNIVIVIIPCVLYGSTIGSLVNDLIPPIVADALILVLLTVFSIKFFLRLRLIMEKSQIQEITDISVDFERDGEREESESPTLSKKTSKGHRMSRRRSAPQDPFRVVIEETIEMGVVTDTVEVSTVAQQMQMKKAETFKQQQILKEISRSMREDKNTKQDLLEGEKYSKERVKKTAQPKKVKILKPKPSKQDNPVRGAELEKQLEYENGYHWKHIIGILGLFAVFQALAFLAEGKLVPFSSCSPYYGMGMGLLTVFFIIVLSFIYTFTRGQMNRFKEIGYEYEYPLNQPKYFSLICLGSFLGGFNGGVFAIGNSTTIIFTLLYLEVEPIVTSATVGFQVVFAAAASLCESLARGNITFETVIFFFLLTFVAGGVLSFIAGRLVGKLNRERVNMILVGIVACLTCASAVSMVINIALGYINFGAHFMITSNYHCD